VGVEVQHGAAHLRVGVPDDVALIQHHAQPADRVQGTLTLKRTPTDRDVK